MDTSKLHSGQVIDNYKELCILTSEPQKNGGNSKKSQIKNWKRYFKFKQDGHKFIIEEVFSSPKDNIDGRSVGNNSKYVTYTVDLLFEHLMKQSENSVVLSQREIMQIVGLCNKNYNESYIKDLIELKKISRHDSFLFEQEVNKKGKEITISTFNILTRNKNIASVNDIYVINENNKLRNSTLDEAENILSTHRLVLKNLGIEKKFLLYVKNKQKIFYEEVNTILINKYGWKVEYEAYMINLNEYYEDFVLDKDDKNIYKEKVNVLFIKFLNFFIEKNFKKFKDSSTYNAKLCSGRYNDDLSSPEIFKKKTKKFYKLPDNYLDQQRYLLNTLIKLLY